MKKINFISLIILVLLVSCDREIQSSALTIPAAQQHVSYYASRAVLNGDTIVDPDGKRIVIDCQCDTTYIDDIPSSTPTVFLGSSSTTSYFWTTMQTNLSAYNPLIIAKGGWFLYHIDQAIYTMPTDVKQVVEWCGENDIYDAKSRGVRLTIGDYMYRFKKIPQHLRSRVPAAKLTYIEVKKTPKLKPWWPFVDSCNAEMKKLVLSQSNSSWVPINHLLTQSDYRIDGMHLKSEVYPRVIEPHVKNHLIK